MKTDKNDRQDLLDRITGVLIAELWLVRHNKTLTSKKEVEEESARAWEAFKNDPAFNARVLHVAQTILKEI